MNNIDEQPFKEHFLALKYGMSVAGVETILSRPIRLKQIREENFKADKASFDVGVTLFFNPESKLLYTIRFDPPFNIPINGVLLGSTKKEVKAIMGIPPREDPFPHYDKTVWIYGKSVRLGGTDFIRFDFEKIRNGKLITVFKE